MSEEEILGIRGEAYTYGYQTAERKLTETLRDRFAIAALTGAMSADGVDGLSDELNGASDREYLAKICYQLADAMLAARGGK